MYTKWKAYKSRTHFVIDAGLPIYRDKIATVYYSQANANLIVSAINGCVSVNPENPQVVAESIKDMYEALKEIDALRERLLSNGIGLNLVYKVYSALHKAGRWDEVTQDKAVSNE